MGVKPNVVLGLIGAIVFVVAVATIVSGFRGFVGLATYQSSFETHALQLPQHANTLGPGSQGRTESYAINHANLTQVRVRLTWEEAGLVAAAHQVTLIVKDARGHVVGQSEGTGGKAGLTVSAGLHPVPSAGRFSANGNTPEAAFIAKYGNHTEDVGPWTVQVLSKGPGGPTDSGISYTLSFDYGYYSGRYARVPELTK